MNEALRRGLADRRKAPQLEAFKVHARDLGELHAGLSLDSVAALIERVEGPLHR